MSIPTDRLSHSGGRRGRHAAAALITFCLLLFGALTAMGAGTPASSALAPPLPAQPGTAAQACQTSTDVPNTWTQLMTETPTGSVVTPDDVFNAWVDPWMPCRLYRGRGERSLERSGDEGRTWSPVFHEDPATPSQLSFLGSSVHVTAPGSVVVSERGNGDAVIRSSDSGAHWNLADSGIEGQPVYDVVAAPSDPTVMYAAVVSAGTAPLSETNSQAGTVVTTAGLFETRDSGTTWTAQVFPPLPALPLIHCGSVCPQWLQVVVDPVDSGHVWMLVTGQETTSNNPEGLNLPNTLIFERSSESAGWQLDTSLPDVASQLVVTHTSRGGQRLYLVVPNNEDLKTRLLVSTDDGQSWTLVTVPGLYSVPFLAADPADGDRMLYAGAVDFPYGVGGVQTYYTTDGFVTWQRGPTLRPPSSDDGMHIIGPGTFTPSGQTLDDHSVSAVIQADRLGRFYLWVQTASTKVGSGWPPTESFWRLTPASTPGGSTGSGRSSSAPPGSLASPPRFAQSMRTVATCPYGNGSRTPSGSLAFDGQSLLYTFYQESSTVPHAGVIHTMDPLTCADTGTMRVDFEPADLATVARHDGFPEAAAHPWISTMTYDADDDALWFSLNVGDPSDFTHLTEPPIFSVSLTHRGAEGTLGRAQLRFFGTHCAGSTNGPEELLSYDFTDHTLWTCDHGGPGHLRASDGSSISSCMAIASYYGQRDINREMTNWTLGAPGELYVSYEDDQSVYEIDSSACTLQQRYQHAQYTEAQDEAEQIACDSLTFSVPRPLPGGLPGTTAPVGSVLWIRDAGMLSGLGSITAFVLPSGRCPFPTALGYSGPPSVAPGGPADLCTTLTLRGHGTPLASLPVRLALGGIDLGVISTDAVGAACVHTRVTLPPGRYPVDASFSGTNAYLGSTATGTLLVVAPGAAPWHGGPPAPLTRAAVIVPPPPQAPAPPAAVNPATQVQVEAQAQAQVQSQTQAQANTATQLQPGLMVQPQRQRQVATQTAMLPVAQYATRTRQLAAALLASAALLPLLAWRRRVAVVEVRRRAR